MKEIYRNVRFVHNVRFRPARIIIRTGVYFRHCSVLLILSFLTVVRVATENNHPNVVQIRQLLGELDKDNLHWCIFMMQLKQQPVWVKNNKAPTQLRAGALTYSVLAEKKPP